MKYLKLFESNPLPKQSELPKHAIIDVISKLQKQFNIIGIEVRDFNVLLSKPYSIYMEMNLKKIPYSIFNLLLLNNDFDAIYPIVIDPVKNLSQELIKNIKVDYTNESKDELYTKSINLVKNTLRNTKFIGRNIVIGNNNIRFNFADSIIEYINNPNEISKHLLKPIYDNIAYNPNHFQIIKEIKEKQPFIYSELLKLYPNIELGNEMGQLGF